jgi:hypothetical protein
MFILALNVGRFKNLSNKLISIITFSSTGKLINGFNLLSEPEDKHLKNSLLHRTPTMEKLHDYKVDDLFEHLAFVKRFSFNTSSDPLVVNY